ncbi:MAG: ribosome silencing factor [Candidatus Promineofilum sp.]|nr:ribosome silencing factor [Promineifilum sp.]
MGAQPDYGKADPNRLQCAHIIKCWRCSLEGLELTRLLVDALQEKKGLDILVLDIHSQAVFADYFVICSGESEPQLRALMQAAQIEAKKQGDRRPKGVEGTPADGWILVDFGDVVVHLFAVEKRAYYDLESLWHKGRVVVRIQ